MCKIYSYVVSGTGPFPFDMLRYDQAWPESNKQTKEIAMVERYFGLEHMRMHAERLGLNALESRAFEEWSVKIEGIRNPTVERWKSFGWTVKI